MNRSMTIREGIDRNLIIVSEDDSSSNANKMLHETRSFAIKSVIDPRTGEEIPVSDAVRHKIVDRSKGKYRNFTFQTPRFLKLT